MPSTVPLEEMIGGAGGELGVSDYVSISQETVDIFAELTNDRQWIHTDPVRAAASPFGGTIVHGYLTLALAPALLDQVLPLSGYAMAVNYGLDKVRFPAALPVGEQVRMRVALDAVDPIPSGVALSLSLTFERAGGGKPVCVASVIYRVYESDGPTMPTTTDHVNGADGRTRGARAGAQAGLDVLLTDAAVGRGTRRFIQPRAVAAIGAGVARHPRRVVRRASALGTGLARVAAGRSQQAPAKGDRRFADQAWEQNWLLRRVMQGYLTVGEAVDGVISDAELDWQTERQARFAAGNVLDALAPTNFPWSNPAVLRALVDEGGANLVRGARRFAADVSWPPRLPQSVDTDGFEVGGNLAASPGSVVLRTEVFELIQYQPTTAEVREIPLLLVPPTINKYYILDLAPGRSMVEYLVASGQQVFVVSWRNPDEREGHFDLDTYAEAVLEARQAVADVTGQPTVHLNAACSGGIITAGTLGHLVAEGTLGEVASLTLFVCALDNERAGTVGALTSREVAAAAVAESARRGYLDGQALAGVFAWLRPNDLVRSYVINNYLLGRKPPAFDVLYWNQDTVRLAAGLHRDFVRLALDNSLARPGGLQVLGSPVDLRRVDLDSYIVAGINDHIVPWENAYQSTQLLGGEKRFVLSTSGHIQALVNPPGPDSRSSYRLAAEHPAEPEDFLDQAAKLPGSWWPDYVEWLAERSGDLRPAPNKLGGGGHRALGKAPGTYVLAS